MRKYELGGGREKGRRGEAVCMAIVVYDGGLNYGRTICYRTIGE
jgi:hypothetical protein